MIDISSLSQALPTLDEALTAHALAPENKFIRDACIQRFEYSYELAHKMLRRYLVASEPAGVHELSFPDNITPEFRAVINAHKIALPGFE